MRPRYNILIAHNYYKISGGEDSVVENETNMLSKYNHRVIQYTKNNINLNGKGIFKKISLFFTSLFSIKTYREVKKILVDNKIDVLHVHNTLPLISPSIYYAAYKCNIPIVQTIHNFRLQCPSATFTRDGKICELCVEKNLLYSLKYKCYRDSFVQSFTVFSMLTLHRLLKTFDKVDAYITLTDFNKNKLSKLISKKDKIHVKPNFFANHYEGDFRSFEREMEDYYVFIGRLDNLKGINLLIESWKEIDGCKLFVIGDGPEKDNLLKYMQDNNIENVEFLGFLQKKEAFKIIKKCKSIIVPSQWYEGFPMTIVEAFSLGVPVIAGEIGNLKTIVKDQENGVLFSYNDKQSLIKGINLLKDTNLNKKLNCGAFKSFIENYTEKINYEQLTKIYNQIMREKGNEKV